MRDLLLIAYVFINPIFSCVDDPSLTQSFESMDPYTTISGCCSAYIEPHNTQNGYSNNPNDRQFRVWITNICDINNQYVTGWSFEHGQGGVNRQLFYNQKSAPGDYRNTVNDCAVITLTNCYTDHSTTGNPTQTTANPSTAPTKKPTCIDWDTYGPYTTIFGCCSAYIEPHNTQNGYSNNPNDRQQRGWITNICNVNNQYVIGWSFEHGQGGGNRQLFYKEESSPADYRANDDCVPMVLNTCSSDQTETTTLTPSVIPSTAPTNDPSCNNWDTMDPYTTIFGCCSAYIEPHNTQNGYFNNPNDRQQRGWITNICNVNNQYVTRWSFDNGQGGGNNQLFYNEESSPADYRADCDAIALQTCSTHRITDSPTQTTADPSATPTKNPTYTPTETTTLTPSVIPSTAPTNDTACNNWDTTDPYTTVFGCCSAYIEPHNTQNGYSNNANDRQQRGWITNICNVNNQYVIGWSFEHGQGGGNNQLFYNEESSPADYRADDDCAVMVLQSCSTDIVSETTANPSVITSVITSCNNWDTMDPYTTTFGCCSAYIEPHNAQNGYVNNPTRQQRGWITNICNDENEYVISWSFDNGQGYVNQQLSYNQQSDAADYRNECNSVTLVDCQTVITVTNQSVSDIYPSMIMLISLFLFMMAFI